MCVKLPFGDLNPGSYPPHLTPHKHILVKWPSHQRCEVIKTHVLRILQVSILIYEKYTWIKKMLFYAYNRLKTKPYSVSEYIEDGMKFVSNCDPEWQSTCFWCQLPDNMNNKQTLVQPNPSTMSSRYLARSLKSKIDDIYGSSETNVSAEFRAMRKL